MVEGEEGRFVDPGHMNDALQSLQPGGTRH